jgi:preprotein translocase subunit SecB
MKILAETSPFQMVRFASTYLQLELIHFPEEEDGEELVYLPDYPIEIDFDVHFDSEDASEFLMVMTILVNGGKQKLPGYSLQVTGNGYFRIQDYGQLEKSAQANFKTFSPVTMLIGTLRSLLSDMTSYSLYGRYNLPSIDVLKLVLAKQAQYAKKSKRKPLG